MKTPLLLSSKAGAPEAGFVKATLTVGEGYGGSKIVRGCGYYSHRDSPFAEPYGALEPTNGYAHIIFATNPDYTDYWVESSGPFYYKGIKYTNEDRVQKELFDEWKSLLGKTVEVWITE